MRSDPKIIKAETGSRLDGSSALVTGSSRGIGRAIAIELARLGARVYVNYLREDKKAHDVVEAILKAGGSAVAFRADVSNLSEMREAFERVVDDHRLDILVNNAGIVRDRSFKNMKENDWREVIDTNLNGVINCCHLAVPLMVARGFGRIVNVASFVGQAGNFGQANYAAAKAGVVGFGKTLSIELATKNVTVNTVCPGFVQTEMWDSVPPPQQSAIIERIPMRRLAQPHEVAQAVRFLVTEANYITGQSININGGIYLA